MTPPSAPPEFVSIADAAAMIGAKPWDIVRLIEAERINTVQLVDVASLKRHQAQGAA